MLHMDAWTEQSMFYTQNSGAQSNLNHVSDPFLYFHVQVASFLLKISMCYSVSIVSVRLNLL